MRMLIANRLMRLRATGLALLLLAVLGSVALPARGAGAADPGDHDLWYVLEMAGKRAGYLHATQTAGGDHIVTASLIKLAIRRGETTIEIQMTSEFVETRGGKPVSMKAVQSLGAAPVTTEYVFGGTAITQTTTQGRHITTTEVPLPEGAWLTPAAGNGYVRKRLEAGAKEITVRMVDAMMGPTPVTMTQRILEETTIETLGKVVPAFKTTTSLSIAPGMDSTDYIDANGVQIRSTANIGGLDITTILADRALALSELDPPELMASTLVKPDQPIKRARGVQRATYVLSLPEGGLTLPDTAVQRVEQVGEGTVRVTVDLAACAPAAGDDHGDGSYLKSTPGLDGDDPEIKALVAKAIRGAGDDKAERAEAMRRFVFEHIEKKDLGVGFATASQVARTRQGDCSEHGALLVAMLRSDGIPSRLATGLMYVDEFLGKEGVFGYHMWAQALLPCEGDKLAWKDLDGTFPRTPKFDATHIVLAVSSGDDGELNSMVALVPMLGRLEVQVEETGHRSGEREKERAK
ncbi:MAG: transglutaminase domain-containing protein [Phycisphaerales bacterium]|nr:transglutaminase domain-containing protein [Phycisphaerales bacterium]